jgi:vancomycin resistance protein VanJ
MTEPLEVGSGSEHSPRGRWLRAASWVYAALVLAALGMIRGIGDGWWVVDVLLLMPRWLFLGPIALLAIASGVRGSRSQWALHAATALVVAGPLMNCSLPIAHLWTQPPQGVERVRVVTYNLAAAPLTKGEFRDWLDREGVDVVCFQEVKSIQKEVRDGLRGGWHFSRNGMVATRFDIVAEMPRFEETFGGGERWSGFLELVRLRTPTGVEFHVGALHLPTIRYGLNQLSDGKTEGVRQHLDWWRAELARVLGAIAGADALPLILAGDFNFPSDDSTMVSLRSHFRFAFEDAGWGYGYTRPSQLPWVRIDHILAGPEWSVTSCRVGPDFGSDHLPLFAELALTGVIARPRPESAPAAPPRNPPGATVAEPAGHR